jgi:glycosyltransferase involved in cell wall biosynthesis
MLEVGEFCKGRVTVDLLPNGIEVDRLVPRRSRTEVRAEFGLPAGRPLLLTAGHLQEWKGQIVAVEAAGLLRDAGREFTWILPGAPLEPRYAERLRARIGELGLGDRIILPGERTDLPDLFAAADVAVHTSIRPEPFGLVVIEAMLQGTPVVGPAEGAIPMLVLDGKDGLLYAPRDAASLAGALNRLLDDPEFRGRLGAAAARRVRAEFDVRVQARRLETIYTRILGDTEGRVRRAGRSG